jgi:RimJ/RimL family protein N-acetyltransferase
MCFANIRISIEATAMLRGQVVTLRPFRAEDLPLMREWFRDPATARTWARTPIVADDAFERDLHDKFSRFDRSGYFAIDDERGNLIGRADFEGLDPVDRTTEVMIVLGSPTSRGKGAGTDALLTLLAYLFHDRQAERVWLTVFDWNEAAIRTYEKVGFVREGRFIDDHWVAGRVHDQIAMGILKSEFDARWPANRPFEASDR